MPMFREHLVVFGPSFDRAGFLSVWPDVECVACAVFDEMFIELTAFARIPGHCAKALVAACEAGEHSFDAEMVDSFSGFMSGALHDDSQKVVGDLHHDHVSAIHARHTKNNRHGIGVLGECFHDA